MTRLDVKAILRDPVQRRALLARCVQAIQAREGRDITLERAYEVVDQAGRMMPMPMYYTTTYCNFAHRVDDGKPVNHECAVLPPKALRAEMEGDVEKAIDLIQDAEPLTMMRRGVRG